MAKRIAGQYQIASYLDLEDYQRLKTEVGIRGRGMTLSKTVRDCLREYFDLREEMATAISSSGDADKDFKGKIIHSLLARTEERIAATIERQTQMNSQVHEQTLIVTAMLDRLYLGLMQHLPEVPSDKKTEVVSSANRRYKNWQEAVEQLIINGNVITPES